jgi:hypothetical protein
VFDLGDLLEGRTALQRNGVRFLQMVMQKMSPVKANADTHIQIQSSCEQSRWTYGLVGRRHAQLEKEGGLNMPGELFQLKTIGRK